MAEQIQPGDVLNVGRTKINTAFSTQVDLWSGSTGSNSIINLNRSNQAIGRFGFVSGSGNTASGDFAVILAGSGHTSSGGASAIVGGLRNKAAGDYSLILGGLSNTANTSYSTVVGGAQNFAGGSNSIILNGTNNKTLGTNAVIMGGDGITGTTDNTTYVANLSIESAITISQGMQIGGTYVIPSPGLTSLNIPCPYISMRSIILITLFGNAPTNAIFVRHINPGVDFEVVKIGGGTFAMGGNEDVMYLVIDTH